MNRLIMDVYSRDGNRQVLAVHDYQLYTYKNSVEFSLLDNLIRITGIQPGLMDLWD